MRNISVIFAILFAAVAVSAGNVRWHLEANDAFKGSLKPDANGVELELSCLKDTKSIPVVRAYFTAGSFNLSASDVIMTVTPLAPVPVTVHRVLESYGGSHFPFVKINDRKTELRFTLPQLVKGKFTPKMPNPANIMLLRLRIAGMKKGQTLKWHISEQQAVPSAPSKDAVKLPEPAGKTVNRAASFEELKPHIKKVKAPIYLMEYHIWYENAFTQEGKLCFQQWRQGMNPHDIDIMKPQGGWRRFIGAPGMPLIGYYHSPARAVQRWQIACMKNAGIDGAFVQLFTSLDGEWWDHMLPIFERALDEAAKQGFKLGIHDEVHFRNAISQNPEVCARRWAKTIKKYGNHPGFLKINGRPAIQFQHWSVWRTKVTFEMLLKAMKKAEELAGQPICFIPMSTPSVEIAKKIPAGYAVVMSGNSNMLSVNSRKAYVDGRTDWNAWQKRMQGVRKQAGILRENGASPWLWCYGVYNENCYTTTQYRWIDSDGGRNLIKALEITDAENPDAILLSSWNDWRESTALEPGFTRDDFNGDPYLYCRILAAAKGKTFVPPPLPPKEVVDPLLWSRLYGIDKTPPEITSAFYAPIDPALTVHCYDAESVLTDARLLRYGNNFIRFGKDAAAKKAALLYPGNAGKVLISAAQSAIISFAETSFKLDDMVYVLLSYKDTAPGRISLNFNAEPARQNFNILGNLDQPTCGDGENKYVLMPLRNWKASAETRLTIRFTPQKSRDKNMDNASVELNAVALAYDFSNGEKGIPSAPGRRYGETYRFNGIVMEGKSEDWIFVQTRDEKGNASRPAVMDLSKCDSIQIREIKL